MRKNYILFLLTILFVGTVNAQVTLTHSATNNIVDGSVACGSGGIVSDNIFYRAFDISSTGYTQFDVTEVAFGIEAVSNESVGFAVDVIIYETTAFPGGVLTELASVSVPLITADSGTIKTVPITATITDAVLVFGVSTPDESSGGGTTGFQIGSNPDGQTAPSYLTSVGCALIAPTDTAAIGFPDMHIVMSVTGNETLSVNDFALSKISISPNPTVDFINLDMGAVNSDFSASLYNITGQLVLKSNNLKKIDMSELNSGVYLLRIESESGSISRKVIKK